MHSKSKAIGSTLAVAVACCLAGAASAATVATHHVREAVSTGEATLVGHLPGNQMLSLDVLLPVRDAAGLEELAAAVSDPSSPSYRQYLTVSEFTA